MYHTTKIFIARKYCLQVEQLQGEKDILEINSCIAWQKYSFYDVYMYADRLVSCPDHYSPTAEEQSGDNRIHCPAFEGRDQSDVVQ